MYTERVTKVRLCFCLVSTARSLLAVCLATSLLPALLAALHTVNANQHSSHYSASRTRGYHNKLRNSRLVLQAFQQGTQILVRESQAHRHHAEDLSPRLRSVHQACSRHADNGYRWGASRTFSPENVLLLPASSHRSVCCLDGSTRIHPVTGKWTGRSRCHRTRRQHGAGLPSTSSVYGDSTRAVAWQETRGGFLVRCVGLTIHERSTGGGVGSRRARPRHTTLSR